MLRVLQLTTSGSAGSPRRVSIRRCLDAAVAGPGAWDKFVLPGLGGHRRGSKRFETACHRLGENEPCKFSRRASSAKLKFPTVIRPFIWFPTIISRKSKKPGNLKPASEEAITCQSQPFLPSPC